MKTKEQQLTSFESICKDHFKCDSLEDLRLLLVNDMGDVDFKNDSVELFKKVMHDIYELGFIDGSKFLP